LYNRSIKFRAWEGLAEEMIPADNLIFETYDPICDQLNDSNGMTYMQYTNLKDCNGKGIYEGDLVKCIDYRNKLEFVAAVKFGNPDETNSWGWKLDYIYGDKTNMDILYWVNTEDTRVTTEVIGNIFEDIGLLEKGSK